MKKINIFIILLGFLLFSKNVWAQLEASNWYFGQNAGINFDPSTCSVTPLVDGAIFTNEGCASISDINGNLLFYTDGTTVYNRNHVQMLNGVNLRGNSSSTQSAIIIPKPLDTNIYYIFTVNTEFQGGGARDANFYEVDMRLDAGLGGVTTNVSSPNRLISNSTEKLAAISTGIANEIIVTLFGNNIGTNFSNFYSYKIDSSGVNLIPVVSQGVLAGDPRGNLKISPDGRFIVACNQNGTSFIYDFDRLTGAVSNPRPINFGANNNAYGVEFSPDSSLLYITATNSVGANAPARDHSSTLYQYELNNANTSAPSLTGIMIDTRQGYRGSLQLGIDGRIYRSLADNFTTGRPFLGVIENPDVIGVGCSYVHDAITLPLGVSMQGLPPFIQSFFAAINIESKCLGQTSTFSFQSDTTPTSVSWDFGDGTTSNLTSPTHVYAAAGVYNVQLTIAAGGNSRIYCSPLTINETPAVILGATHLICDDDFDGSEMINLQLVFDSQVLADPANPDLRVTYYNSQLEADSGNNALPSLYTVNNPNTILFARVENLRDLTCYSTTTVEIRFFNQPMANPVTNLEVCDDDFDGIITFDLSSQTSAILGSQNVSDFNISYHSSQIDADDNSNALALSYANTNAFNETVYIRIENVLEPSCADTTQSFDLIVNPKPVANDFSAFQCDEDGTADGRTVFSLMSFDDSISASATGVSVSYFINQNDADANVSALDNVSYINLSPMQNIIARVTNNSTGCYTTSTVTLSVSASDAQDTSLSTCDDDGMEDGFAEFDLSNADSNVLISAPANVSVDYYASLNDALTEQNTLPNLFTNTTPNNQTLFARAESSDGNCFGISEVLLTVKELPFIEESELYDYCGNNPQPLTIDSGILTGSQNEYTYLWSTGATTSTISVTTGGVYTVTITNLEGCSKDRLIRVIISEPATINSIETVNAGTSIAGSATINATGLGDYEYRINLEDSYQDSPIFNNLVPGFYTAYVRDKNGCGITTMDFTIVGYPRFFTPNNDGFNDYWQLIGVSVTFEPNSKIFIFDRYGKLLKQVSPQGPGWDGTYNGTPLPSSDYWFKATLMDGTTFSSHFTLKR